MNDEQVTRLKEDLNDALWAIIRTQDALPGEEREHAENRIWEAFDRANEVRREIQAPQGQARQQNRQNRPSERRYNRKILW